MAHSPRGKGQAAAIRRNSSPAILHTKAETGISKWRKTFSSAKEDIQAYLILSEEQSELVEDGEEKRQWAVIYTVDKRLNIGEMLEFADKLDEHGKTWRFLIRKSADRPAINPAYYKAWGIKQD